MGNANTLAIEVPISALEIREDSSTNLYSVHLSIVADIKDKSGAVVEHFSEDIPRRGPVNEVEAAKHSVITFQRHFVAPRVNLFCRPLFWTRTAARAAQSAWSLRFRLRPALRH